jgi:heme exporter protein CcmD
MNFAAPHIGFVIAAYAIAFVVIGGMIVGTLADYRTLKKSLERVEARMRRVQDPNS